MGKWCKTPNPLAPPNSGEKSGSFARFMEFLGPRYLEDARELLGRNTLRRIETEMSKKHKKDRKPPPGQSEFIQLSTMVKLLETVLIVLREYPSFDALCRVPGKSDDDCEQPAQQSVEKRYEDIERFPGLVKKHRNKTCTSTCTRSSSHVTI